MSWWTYWKQVGENILHCEDMHQLPLGPQRRLHFSYYMFHSSWKFLQRAHNLLLLQLDKSNNDIYEPLLKGLLPDLENISYWQ